MGCELDTAQHKCPTTMGTFLRALMGWILAVEGDKTAWICSRHSWVLSLSVFIPEPRAQHRHFHEEDCHHQ